MSDPREIRVGGRFCRRTVNSAPASSSHPAGLEWRPSLTCTLISLVPASVGVVGQVQVGSVDQSRTIRHSPPVDGPLIQYLKKSGLPSGSLAVAAHLMVAPTGCALGRFVPRPVITGGRFTFMMKNRPT